MKEYMNIIYFVVHDLGKELGAYGRMIETPNLDGFAKQGAIFNHAFCNSPACSPSRNCAYTGLYAHVSGAIGLAHVGYPLPEKIKTVVDYLNEAGVETAHVGLQHERHGISNRYQVEMNPTDDFQKNRADRAVDTAIEYLKTKRDMSTPFYLNIGTHEVHATGWQDQANGRSKDLYGGTEPEKVHMPIFIPDTKELRKEMGNFHASINFMDKQFGRLLTAIDELGFRDNTLVVFTTDHGISSERSKGTLYDRGVEISLMARLPGSIKAWTQIDELIPNIDIMPTLLEALAVEIPKNINGRSFWKLLTGNTYLPWHEIFLERNFHGADEDFMRSVRSRRFHYIKNYSKGKKRALLPFEISQMNLTYSRWLNELWPNVIEPRPFEELYDTENDPQEFINLADRPEYENIKSDLSKKMSAWMKETKDFLENI